MSEHGLTRMEQLLAFCDWEENHNPVPGKTHIARWAADEIERLTAERDAWRRLVVEHNARIQNTEWELDLVDRYSIAIPPELQP